MNPPARTRMYTSIAAGASQGCGTGQIELCWSSLCMLQVQCISLPKRFVPSVSKCPSVVLPPLSCLSLSLFLPFSFSPNRHDLRPSISPARYRFARANASSGEKEGKRNPRLITRARARSTLARKLSALHQRNLDELVQRVNSR